MEWINVKDRLPEESGEYFVWYDGCCTRSICRYSKINGWYAYDGNKITHWMPLPDPPGKRENESEVDGNA